MFRLFWLLTFLLVFTGPIFASDGVITTTSSYGAEETAGHLEILLKEKGMTVFNRNKKQKSAEELLKVADGFAGARLVLGEHQSRCVNPSEAR